MASVVVNNGTIHLTRGVATFLGTLTAAVQVVQFTIPEPVRDAQGFVIIQSRGTAGTTATLQVSVDQGVSWATLGSSATIVFGLTPLNGDTAAGSSDAFQVNGMGSGTLFRFGFSGVGVPNCQVWACYG